MALRTRNGLLAAVGLGTGSGGRELNFTKAGKRNEAKGLVASGWEDGRCDGCSLLPFSARFVGIAHEPF